ncbi:copper chaperone PCu(A)C [Caulobacter sp. 17J80-11]|uniref:copper chaperone PCu(A)C n=1 Tax=Caulobacter sp. 17J80-11 TaxID=2763502 RepID=UPI001653475D|nr:copper chaperone PCu(A)C [Caulobacter sp. 17J80-11]MBC6983577.1 copper chaperone PCu(A)C [Caulobacter sp. 17J80-11]
MSARVFAVAAAVLALAAVPAAARQASAGSLVVKDTHMRASLGNNPNTGAYLTVTNRGAAKDRLVGASCACAARVELHEMSDVGGVMKMKKVDGFEVPAGGQLVLAPRGKHLMVFGLKQPVKTGDMVQMTLRFEKAGAVTTAFHVMNDPGATGGGGHHH